MSKPPSPSKRPAAELRCAIYTRKSSEEGLEQEFNSLHAQREACLAYIQSQRHEGWTALPTLYDDGGVSGGTLARPALTQLLADVRARRIDLVVIYKVDRLTRSLADFAKLVEVFNEHNVSFVSVTQQFNTATSMGRLTLNMLMSFAQFEREVTGERIRDKIAASKRKGMWMGGNPPLGYEVRERKLVIVPSEAEDVCTIFRTYLELGSVRELAGVLAERGLVTKRRLYPSGKALGGKPFLRGNLYKMLQNPLYRGRVHHQGNTYEGEHEAIIDLPLWKAVQAKLAANRYKRGEGVGEHPSLLAGLVFDQAGARLSPSHAQKGARRYRYYISHTLTKATRSDCAEAMRIPAGELEKLISGALRDALATPTEVTAALAGLVDAAPAQRRLIEAAGQLAASWGQLGPTRIRAILLELVERITIGPGQAAIQLRPEGLIKLLSGQQAETGCQPANGRPSHLHSITVPTSLRRVGQEVRLVVRPTSSGPRFDPALAKLIAQALQFKSAFLAAREMHITELAAQARVSPSYFTRVLRIGFLAPDIVRAIALGEHPKELAASRLVAGDPPALSWAEQREQMGLVRD